MIVVLIFCNKHWMGCEAQLAWKCLFMPIFWQEIYFDPWSRSDLPSFWCAMRVHL